MDVKVICPIMQYFVSFFTLHEIICSILLTYRCLFRSLMLFLVI